MGGSEAFRFTHCTKKNHARNKNVMWYIGENATIAAQKKAIQPVTFSTVLCMGLSICWQSNNILGQGNKT